MSERILRAVPPESIDDARQRAVPLAGLDRLALALPCIGELEALGGGRSRCGCASARAPLHRRTDAALAARWLDPAARLAVVEMLHELRHLRSGPDAGPAGERVAAAARELPTTAVERGRVRPRGRAVRAARGARDARGVPCGGAAAARRHADRLASLSTREREIAVLVATGYANKEMAARLGIGPSTVAFHVSNLLAKLHLRSRADLAVALARPRSGSATDCRRYTPACRRARPRRAGRRGRRRRIVYEIIRARLDSTHPAARGRVDGEEARMAAASARNLVLRYLTFIVGIFVMSLGIAMTVHAQLGTTPVSAIPLVMSFATPFTIGFYTVAINAVLLLAQILILRRRFEPIQLLQLPAAFVFGGFCDLSVWLLEGFRPEFYLWQALYSIAGSAVLGVGVWLQVTPRVLMLAGDGISAAISQVSGREFGSVKIVIDSLLVATAAVLSLVLLHGLVGVREGTFVSAFLVGWVVRLLQRRVPWPAALRRPEPAR